MNRPLAVLAVFVEEGESAQSEASGFWEQLGAPLIEWVPPGIALVVVAVLLAIVHLATRKASMATGSMLSHHVWMFVFTVIGSLVVLVLIPNPELQVHVLQLFGIAVTAVIALSSTTFIGNAMAGGMLKALRSFRTGDFIQIGEHFGRVSERSLIHTEIQTEDRDLTTLPNLYLVTNPVKVIRSSGTIISATVSLGYDVPHARAEELLLEAVRCAELVDPFVQVTELGDYSVTYRAAGLLSDVKQILSYRSRIRRCMLDALHGGGVEIVSPTFMNTRSLNHKAPMIPEPVPDHGSGAVSQSTPEPEAVIFDKADEAESIERKQLSVEKLSAELVELNKKSSSPLDEVEKRELEALVRSSEARREELSKEIEYLQQMVDDRDKPEAE